MLDGGLQSGLVLAHACVPDPAALPTVDAQTLAHRLADASTSVVDLRSSAAWIAGHIPGSMWSIRPRLAATLAKCRRDVTLVADDPRIAAWAVSDLPVGERYEFSVLDGGFATWCTHGGEVRQVSDALPLAARIDYLFFTHDRHAGNKAASRAYLDWELGLLAQIDEPERNEFRPLTHQRM